MTPLMIAALGALMVATAFLSGLFGMAGGLILIGVLLALMPLPTAMVLHAITQMASNGWRAFLWRAHIRWRPVSVYLIGCALALGPWSITRYVPDKPIALLILGVTPFLARLLPKDIKPNPDSVVQGTLYGSICMGLMLMTGVSGPLLDTFFLGGEFRAARDHRDQGDLPGREPLHQADLFRRHHRPGRNARSRAGGGRGRGLHARHHAVAARAGGDERPAIPPLGQPADHDGCELLHPLWRLAAGWRRVRRSRGMPQ